MSAMDEPIQSKSSTGKIIGLIGCGCLGLALVVALIIGGIFYFVSAAMKSSDAYSDSIAAVSNHPAAIAALGEPIEPGFMPMGSININNGEGDVNFTIPVSGPKGKGTIRVIGTKPAGSPAWIYETWQLEVEGNPEPILLGN